MIIDFGSKNKGKELSDCDEKYLKWLISHEKVLAKRNRWASRDANFVLERRAQVADQKETRAMPVTTKINSTVCTRCHGSGEYSYNLKDGTVCYGCGGTGQVVIAPKGQKKIKPTCTSIHKAKVGDILEVSCILYKVEAIKWIAYSIKNGLPSAPSKQSNQQIIATRLVDGKKYGFKRAVCNAEGFAIQTPEEWIGKDVVGKGIAE